MARISTYGQDSTLNKLDKVLGTDSLTGQTKNYTIESIVSVVNEDSLVESFDGSTFTYQDYVASSETPTGVINLNAGTASQAAFSAINQIYISVLDKTGLSVAEYLENADNDFIKISKKGNVNQFGIYEVTAIEDHDSAAYKKLTLTPRGTNGNLTVDDSFFVSNYSALYDQDFSDDSVTEFGDVTSAGSGIIITDDERTSLNNFTANGLIHADVVDVLTSTAVDVPLSANQGKALKDLIDTINALLASDNVDLDSLQEVVDFIEANKETLDSLAISNIAGLTAALNAKEDSVEGKGLSANDFTDILLTKLNSIASGAQVNVQSNWSAISGDAFIQNKPTDLTNLSLHNVTDLSDVTDAGSGSIITSSERTKLSGIATGAEVNVQSDWNATTGDSFIQNKPTTITEAQASAITANASKVSNVKSDWSETDTNSEAFIQNKPDLTVTKAAVDAAIGVPASDNDDKFYRGDGVWAEVGATTTLGSLSNVASLSDSVNNINQFLFWNAAFDGGKWMPTWLHTYQLRDIINTDPGTAQAGKFLKSSSVGSNNWQFAPASLEINDLSDFEITNPQDNQILQYSSTNSEFQNVTDVVLPGTLEFGTTEASTPTFDNGLYYKTEDGHDTLHFRYDGHDLSIDKLTELLPTGILNGGELSNTNSTQFIIQAGDGIINDLNKIAGQQPHPEIISIEWLTQTINVVDENGDAITVSPTTVQKNSWIYIDASGNVQQQSTAFTEAQFRSTIPIGSVVYTNGSINFVKTFPRTAYNQMSQHSEFIASFGPLKKSGHKVSANGANLSIDRSAGTAFALGRNYSIDPENPSTVVDGAKVGAVIHRYRSDGSGSFIKDTNSGAGYATIDPTKYDDGTGTLANVSGGHYSVQRLFYFPTTPDVIVSYYGTDEYNSLDTAEKNYLLESFTEADNTAQQAIYLGAIVMSGATTDLTDSSDAKILTAGTFRSLASTNLGGVAASAQLGDLVDVNVTGTTDNQLLQYNSSTTEWEASTVNSDGIAEGTTNLYYTEARVAANSAVALNTAKTGITSEQAAAIVTNTGKTGITTEQAAAITANTEKDSFPGFGTTATTALAGNTAFVDGSGTAGSLPKFSDTDTLTDSVISESGQVVDIATTGAIRVPDGTTAERPDPAVAGMFRYNTDDDQFEGYTTEWGAIAGSGGGGVAGTIVKKTFSGNGSNRDFVLDDAIASKQNVDVYVNGVYQFPSNYEVSGSTVTFDADAIPASGTENVSITHLVSVAGTEGSSMQKASFTGNGTTRTFALGDTPQAKSFTIVHVQGIYQESSTYDISGSNIVFTTAPSNGHTVEVTFIAGTISVASLDVGSQTINSFTGTGSATSFDLAANAVSDKNYTDVYINGVYQAKDQYELSGTNIVFDTAPQNGYSIEVKCHSASASNVVSTSTMTSDVFTADGASSTFPLVNGSPVSKEFTMVFVSGIYQQKSAYNLSGSNIVFDGENPAEDDTIEVITLSSLNNTSSPVTSVNGQTGAISITSDVTSVQNKTGAVTLVSADIPGVIDTSDDTTGLTFWTGTQAEYDALSTYDSTKLYFIT